MENHEVGHEIYTEWRVSDFSTVMRKTEKHPLMHQHAKIQRKRESERARGSVWKMWMLFEATSKPKPHGWKKNCCAWQDGARRSTERRSNDISVGLESENEVNIICSDRFATKSASFSAYYKLITFIYRMNWVQICTRCQRRRGPFSWLMEIIIRICNAVYFSIKYSITIPYARTLSFCPFPPSIFL